MPFVFSRCHCEEALAEADVAIQSGVVVGAAHASAGLPRRGCAPPRNDNAVRWQESEAHGLPRRLRSSQ